MAETARALLAAKNIDIGLAVAAALESVSVHVERHADIAHLAGVVEDHNTVLLVTDIEAPSASDRRECREVLDAILAAPSKERRLVVAMPSPRVRGLWGDEIVGELAALEIEYCAASAELGRHGTSSILVETLPMFTHRAALDRRRVTPAFASVAELAATLTTLATDDLAFLHGSVLRLEAGVTLDARW